ncbi:MAG: hypothetical protein AB1508_07145 [Pseudomonadota bacterium]
MSALGLVVELVAGAIGGNGIASAVKTLNLGTLGNTLVGAIGGAAGTSVLGALVPALENVGHVDMSALGVQAVSGGVLGAVLTAVVAAIRNASSGAPAP